MPTNSAVDVDASWPDAPATHVAMTLPPASVARAVAALARRDGELEVLVTVRRPDGLLIVSATTGGCVGSFQPHPDADWTQLVGDVHREPADEVEVVLGGQLVTWPRRHLAPDAAGRHAVQRFGSSGPPLPGTWERPPHR